MKKPIHFRLNGRATTLDTNPDRTLLWVLRTDLELTGAKYGCGVGVCGSCTVVVDGEVVRSCQATLKDVKGTEVTTIEGLARDGLLSEEDYVYAMNAEERDRHAGENQ